ncbi:hypothetical protein M758_4G093900 [Ceratodon purpureus]|nr:hypothetical protein M758_4G093900 [Ceratodon purpureus]
MEAEVDKATITPRPSPRHSIWNLPPLSAPAPALDAHSAFSSCPTAAPDHQNCRVHEHLLSEDQAFLKAPLMLELVAITRLKRNLAPHCGITDSSTAPALLYLTIIADFLSTTAQLIV